MLETLSQHVRGAMSCTGCSFELATTSLYVEVLTHQRELVPLVPPHPSTVPSVQVRC